MEKMFLWAVIGPLGLILMGCARITTQVVEKPRVDQEMSGNRGYLLGAAQPSLPRKSTRKILQTDIELPTGEELTPWKIRKAPKETPAQAPRGSLVEPVSPMEWEVPSQAAPVVPQKPSFTATTYTVKKGDTLEKIAKSFYGDSKKWRRIYNANRESLSNPNRLYPGQKLAIPQLEEGREERGFAGDLK